MKFLPQVEELIDHGKSTGGDMARAAQEVEQMVANVLKTDGHL